MTTPLRLVVHVGSPKTGTTYLQDVLQRAVRSGAAASGPGGATPAVRMLPERRRDAFWLMQDVRGRLDARLDEPAAFDALPRFRRAMAELVETGAGGTVLLSEEQLGAADPEQVTRLLDHAAGAQVHVVVTTRGLARALPSYWQQQLQVGARVTFEEYVAQVRERRGGFGPRFWRAWDPTSVLERWGPAVGSDRFHVVTVPRGGQPRELLDRFCQVLGTSVTDAGTDVARRRNESLGWPQAEVLRQVSVQLPDRLRNRRAFRAAGKEWLGLTHLAAQGGERIVLPSRLEEWCREETARVVRGLADVHVVGDLADLDVAWEDFGDDRWSPDESAVRAAAVDALASIVAERADGAAAPRPGLESGSGRAGLAARAARRARAGFRR